jgi:hypothetical protein
MPREGTMKVKTKQTHHVDYNELQDEIEEAFGKPYCFQSDVECGNDTVHEECDITKEEAAKMDEFDKEDLEEWKAAKYKQLWGPRILMLDMVRRGIIPEGDYIISVSY